MIERPRVPNKATAPNAAMTLWFQIEHDWRGIGESRRWAIPGRAFSGDNFRLSQVEEFRAGLWH
jgi:hypothetical protein